MSERQVVVGAVDEDRSPEQVGGAFGAEANRALSPKQIEFVKYDGRHFLAEYQLIDRKLVFHFYVRPEFIQAVPPQQLEHWWLNDFATHLDFTAQLYFQATAPRIQARYTEEVASWFLRAQGFADLLDPLAFARVFLERLDDSFGASPDPQPASR